MKPLLLASLVFVLLGAGCSTGSDSSQEAYDLADEAYYEVEALKERVHELEQRIDELESASYEASAYQSRSLEATYRKECEETRDENIESVETFLSACAKGQDLDKCAANAGELFGDVLSPSWVDECVSNKL